MTRKLARKLIRKPSRKGGGTSRVSSKTVPSDHCDDYIDDPAAPVPLRAFLAFARAPAHGLFLPLPHPVLFADHEGERVRVTMASHFGDVGITAHLSAEFGYEARVHVSQLSNFAEVP